jgi:eukaryotic-like serine/threonine-protein kinase
MTILLKTQSSLTAVQSLLGRTIGDGWLVTDCLPRPGNPGGDDLTGSWFSQGYIVRKAGRDAFLKAIDVERALAADPNSSLMGRLKRMTESHDSECTLLNICRKARLSKVVQILEQGEIPADTSAGIPYPIPFILSEKADGDVRKLIARSNSLEVAWKLSVLHDVAVGIQQLHGQQIAHQDLKPSNVLLFDSTNSGAKIGDLGRASQKGAEANHDSFTIAGAANYAPPEQAYGVRPEKWTDRRESCDLYHLGSLVCFIFSGRTPTSHYIENLSKPILPTIWGGEGKSDYANALPLLNACITEFVARIDVDFPVWCRAELKQMILNACEPSYEKRGDPKFRAQVGNPIGIQSFVSRFDRLSKQAMIKSRQ